MVWTGTWLLLLFNVIMYIILSSLLNPVEQDIKALKTSSLLYGMYFVQIKL